MGGSLRISRSYEDKNDQSIAEPSEKIKKAKEKLAERFKSLDEKVTQECLDQKIVDIHAQIAKQAQNRVFVEKGGSFALFDNNKHPAESSKRVASLAENILKDASSVFQKVAKQSN